MAVAHYQFEAIHPFYDGNGRTGRIQYLVDCGVAKRQTASSYLKQLADIGVLEERQAGREKLFVNPRLMHLMTEDSNRPEPFDKH